MMFWSTSHELRRCFVFVFHFYTNGTETRQTGVCFCPENDSVRPLGCIMGLSVGCFFQSPVTGGGSLDLKDIKITAC